MPLTLPLSLPLSTALDAGLGVARKAIAACAADATYAVTRRPLVVVAPHPDDETLGCGATIARAATAGSPVTVVVVSDGSRSHESSIVSASELAAIRRSEARAAVARLGGGVHLRFLDFPDGALPESVPAMARALESVFDDVPADIVLSPMLAEPHPDHAAVARAVRIARSRRAASGELLEYPVWLWSRWPGSGSVAHRVAAAAPHLLGRAVRVSTSGGHLDRKREALDAYATQMTHYRGDPDWHPLPPRMVARFFGAFEVFFPARRPALGSVALVE